MQPVSRTRPWACLSMTIALLALAACGSPSPTPDNQGAAPAAPESASANAAQPDKAPVPQSTQADLSPLSCTAEIGAAAAERSGAMAPWAPSLLVSLMVQQVA